MRLDDVHAFEQDDADLYRLIVHDDQGEQHSLFMNTHLACELHDLIVKVMGPYIFERNAAKAEHDRRDPYADEDDGPWPGESVMSFYQRTGQEGALAAVHALADELNKARRENQ
jgi:hypothetical protein